MSATVPNPFPLNIGTKQDSWDKLQLLQYLDPSLKLSAAELNSIVQALNWLHNQTGGDGDLDGIIQIGTLAIVTDPNVPGGLALNIPNLPLPTWRINSIIYSKPTNTFVSIPAAASDKYRIDYVVANTSNTFQRVTGEERSDIGVPPQLPANTVLVCEIHIFGTEIGTPIPTTAGFITRSSQQYKSFLLLDVPPKVFQLSSEYTSFIIKNSAGSGLVAGFTTAGIGSVGNPPHDGMDIYIKNVGAVAFTLQHNNTTDAAVPFFFADTFDLAVPAGAILHFKYNVAGRVELVGVAGTAGGSGDMLASVYDPTGKAANAFAMDNMANPTATKTTPIDADSLNLWDSVSSIFKKVTWANIKATLKTYFDTLYKSVTSPQFEWSANTTIAPTHNNAMIFTVGYTTTIDPNTQTYQTNFEAFLDNTGSATGASIVCTAATGYTYSVNGATAVASGTFTLGGRKLCYITRKLSSNLIKINGDVS